MKKWGLALALVLAAPTAWSQEQTGGLFLGVSGIAAYTDAARTMESITGGTHDKSVPNGGKVFGGYMWDRWGVELAYYYLGKYDFLNAPAVGQIQDQLETRAVTMAGVYEAQMAPTMSLFFRAGLAITRTQYDCKLGCGSPPFLDTKKTATSGMGGVGLGFRLTQRSSVRLEWEHFGSVHHAVANQEFKDAYDLFSLGVRLMF